MAKTTNYRDPRLDGIRGLLLIVMTIDHFPCVIRNYTYEGAGFVSAAEGFVFLSGYVAALSYGRTLVQQGYSVVKKRAMKRAGTIYLLHLCTFLFAFAAMGVLGEYSSWQGTWQLRHQHPGTALVLGVTLLYQPQYNLDILPMYCVFVLALPALILALQRGRWLIVLWGSVVIWGLAQLGATGWITDQSRKFLPVDFGSFDILAWQLLFVGGMLLGYHKLERKDSVIRIGTKGYFLIVALAGLFCLYRHDILPRPGLLQSDFIDRHLLGPIRLLNFAILMIVFSHPSLWPQERIWTRSLGLLGRHSLWVFGFHLVLIYGIHCFVAPPLHLTETGWGVLAIISAGLLYVPAWLLEAFVRPKHSAVA